jgi:hypothetical protein
VFSDVEDNNPLFNHNNKLREGFRLKDVQRPGICDAKHTKCSAYISVRVLLEAEARVSMLVT